MTQPTCPWCGKPMVFRYYYEGIKNGFAVGPKTGYTLECNVLNCPIGPTGTHLYDTKEQAIEAATRKEKDDEDQ